MIAFIEQDEVDPEWERPGDDGCCKKESGPDLPDPKPFERRLYGYWSRASKGRQYTRSDAIARRRRADADHARKRRRRQQQRHLRATKSRRELREMMKAGRAKQRRS